MAITNKNKRMLHRKEWQMMTKLPVNTGAWSFIIKDPLGVRKTALMVVSATVQYIFRTDEDGWVLAPNMALAGAFGAGACGAWMRWSNNLTATGGDASKLTLTTAINELAIGRILRFSTGPNAGLERTITKIRVIAGGTNEIYFDTPFPNAVANGNIFAITSGLYVAVNAYASLVAGVFKSYDPLTWAVTSLNQVGLPATWGTEGRLVGTPSYTQPYSIGTATAWGASTLTCTGKTWTVNQWTNYQIRITAGTGVGQAPRNVASNTANQITTSTAWTITPDTSSVFAIEANDDNLYLLGNNNVAVYKYNRTANTWATMAPTTARASAMVAWGGANWFGLTGDTDWANESAILDGRYIVSPRGGGSSAIDRLDLAGGTAGAGAWANMAYVGASETFTTGSSYDTNGQKLFMRKENTNRIFQYDIVYNQIMPFSTLEFPDGTAVIGDKMFTASLQDGTDFVDWLYVIQSTGQAVHRVMIF